MLELAPQSLRDELRAKRDRLIDAMTNATDALPERPAVEHRQFLAGYLDLVTHAAAGDDAPRAAYLETVIPGVKASGMALDFVLAQMAGVAMAVAAEVAKEHLAWHVSFTRNYVGRLVRE